MSATSENKNQTSQPPAVILLSGGLDSATVLAIARRDGFALHAISFDYGQRDRFELKAAVKIAQSMQIESHVVMPINLGVFGGSALTDDSIGVPQHMISPSESANAIPVTYVPARNTVFLSLALAFAETIDASDIFIGANAVDYSGYPDCRPEFIDAFEQVANLGTRAGVERRNINIHAPLMSMSKSEIIQTGSSLGVDYAMTHSCYDPASDGSACGRCDSCHLRRQGFIEAGADDPTLYVD